MYADFVCGLARQGAQRGPVAIGIGEITRSRSATEAELEAGPDGATRLEVRRAAVELCEEVGGIASTRLMQPLSSGHWHSRRRGQRAARG